MMFFLNWVEYGPGDFVGLVFGCCCWFIFAISNIPQYLCLSLIPRIAVVFPFSVCFHRRGLHSVYHIDDLNFDNYEMIQNYNVLQDVFNKMKITERIEVNRLIKGRPLDSLEFMQWMRPWMRRYCGGHNEGLINNVCNRGTSEREEQMVFVTTRLDEEIEDSKDGTY
ncbi:hypothetical protein OROMI_006959 [Orobanche minor]